MARIKEERKEDFEAIFLEAVDEGLRSTLGNTPTRVIYYHFEKKQLLKREDIPYKPEVFAEGLDKILGTGATIIKTFIIKNLYKKLELDYEELEDKDFLSCVEYAKKRMKSQKCDVIFGLG